jgi:hypothetical protein
MRLPLDFMRHFWILSGRDYELQGLPGDSGNQRVTTHAEDVAGILSILVVLAFSLPKHQRKSSLRL